MTGPHSIAALRAGIWKWGLAIPYGILAINLWCNRGSHKLRSTIAAVLCRVTLYRSLVVIVGSEGKERFRRLLRPHLNPFRAAFFPALFIITRFRAVVSAEAESEWNFLGILRQMLVKCLSQLAHREHPAPSLLLDESNTLLIFKYQSTHTQKKIK